MLKSGRKSWTLIGAYIPPSETDGSSIDCIKQARETASKTRPVILLGDLNVDLNNIRSGDGEDRRLETAALIADLGVGDILDHFRIRKKNHGEWTWEQIREGRRIRARCDYILSDSEADFSKCQIIDTHLDTDHRMMKGVLELDCGREHRKYVQKRTRRPRIYWHPRGKSRADIILEELEEDLPKQDLSDQRQQSYLEESTWALIDRKAFAKKRGDTETVAVLRKKIRAAVRKDRRARAEKAAATAEFLLKKGKIKEAYDAIKGWYREVSSLPPKPTYGDEEKIRKEFQALFSRVEPEGEPIPVHYEGGLVDDGPPTEEEVVRAVRRLKFGKAPGASGIRAEDISNWYKLARVPEEGAIPLRVDVRRW